MMRLQKRFNLREWMLPLGLLLIPLAITVRTWRAWGDHNIDFPHQLYISWRVSVGDILYRDLEYVYGPASQWLNGAIFWLFGVSYLTQTMANLAFSLVIFFLIYFFVRDIFDEVSAILASLSFAMIHMFQHAEPFGCFNFLGPYCHEAVHGTLLLLVLVWLCSRKKISPLNLFFQGLACGVSFLMKPEYLLAGFLLMTFSFHRTGKRKKLLFFWVPGFLFPLFMSLIYFLAHAKFSFLDSLRATAASLIPLFGYGLARTPFYEAAMGTDDLLQNLKAMGKALAFVCGALGGGLFCDWIAKENRKKFWRVLFLIAITAIPLHFSFLWLSRAWPILCLAGIFFLICVRRKNLFEERTFLAAFLLGVWSVTLSAKIFFHPVFTMFGFYLLVPGTIFLSVLGYYLVPRWLKARGIHPLAFRAVVILLLAFISIQSMLLSIKFYDLKNLAIGSGDDAFFAFRDLAVPGTASARLVKEALERVERKTEPGSSVLAIPEGMMVNYLLRRRNPTPFLQSFILSTLYNFSGGSRAIIAGLQEKKPDYIFYLRRGPEFPGPAFQMRGNGGFAEESLRWIESHYHEVDRIGPASNDFNELFFVLWKRNTP